MPTTQKYINMDPTNQVENQEVADNETSQLSNNKCLSVPLIINQILQHVTNADLIQFSMINKLWNYEARSMMRERGCFAARLKSDHPCEQLPALISLIQNMTVLPFGGISMDLNASHIQVCSMSSNANSTLIQHDIINGLPWKNLSIKLTGDLTMEMMCPAFQLSIRVLQKFCENLEQLSLHVDQFSVKFVEKVIEHSKFPRLKILRYETEALDLGLAHTSLIQAVVSRAAPNPLELHLNKYYDVEMERILKGGSVEIVADYELNLGRHYYFPRRLIDRLRVKNLNSSYHQLGQAFSIEKLNRIVPVLLRSSRTLLNTLHVDLVHLLPLMRDGVSLTSLTSLIVDVGLNNQEEPAQPQMLKLLQAFDFTRLFPRLKKLDLVLYSSNNVPPCDDFGQSVEQQNGIWMEPRADGADNIKHLVISSTSSSFSEDSIFPFLAPMFPHIGRLSLDTYETRTWDSLFKGVWEHWADIQELEVGALFGNYIISEDRLSIQTLNENLDSEFCGIFPEEVTELRLMDDEYLKAVNIVPVMPSIACFRELRTLKMFCGANCYPIGKHDTTFMVSKVACLLVFARCPHLSVTFATNSHPLARALKHVKPYASVVLDEAMGKLY